MANGLLGYINRVDDGTVTVSGALPGLPAGNVQDSILARVCRVQATSWVGVVDFGADYPVGAVDLAGIAGASASATLRIEMDSSDAFSGGYDSDTDGGTTDIDTGLGVAVHIPAAAQTYRYLRATLSDGSASFLDVGRLWAGATFQPGINFAYGYAERSVDASERQTAPWSGAQYVDIRAHWRVLTPTWEFLTVAEAKDTVREIARLVGRRQQVLFIPDPASSRLAAETVIGRLAEPPTIEYPPAPGYHAVRLTIEESK